MIRRIELHNFASHHDTELELGGGKNVIIGATGSGKTGILQALDFAFQGDVSDLSLSELISDNSDTTEVVLEYEDPRTGERYRIHRALKRTPEGRTEHECTLTNLATGEVIKKPEPVRRTLESFGVDPSVWKYIVHIPQGKFADLLEETQERKVSLDKLFQVSQLENAYQELGRREGPITQIERRKEEKNRQKTRLQETANRLQQETRQLDRIIEQRSKKEEELDRIRKDRDKLDEIAKKSAETLNELKITEDAIWKAQIASQNALNQINKLSAPLQRLLPLSTCASIKQLPSSKVTEYLQDLQQDLQQAKENEHQLEKTHSESIANATRTQSALNATKQELKTVTQEITAVEEYLAGRTEQPNIACDRCGSILSKTEWTRHLEERRKTTIKLEELTRTYTKQSKDEQTHLQDCRSKLEEARSITRNIEHAIPLVQQVADQRHIIEHNQDTKHAQTKNKLLTELRSILSVNATQSDQEVVNNTLAIPQQLKTFSSRILELSKELTNFDENYLNPQKRRVEEAQRAKEEMSKLDPEINSDMQKIQLLETVRTTLREIQPAVRRNFVTKITTTANDYLKHLYGGTELEHFEISEDYQFLVTRAGYKRHARRLSGGQQVLASMALVLALSEVLSQLDFLILDEPTTHLDASRRRELVKVLEKLRRIPQLIIVDHHPELFEAADIRFQVNLNPEGTSQLSPITSVQEP